jgi:peptidylprolyl isomerase
MPLLSRLIALCLLLVALPLAAQVRPLPAPSPLDAPPKQAIPTATGVAYVVLKPAPKPQVLPTTDMIEFRANAWSADGETRINGEQSGPILGSMRRLMRGQPALARAIMSTPIGETRRWWFDAERMKPGYPGMPELPHVLEVTVLREVDPTKAPADVAAPPADAVRTATGLAYKVLKRGKGGGRPTLDDAVMIHYTGWTTDGAVFDSSVQRGSRATFPLRALIDGWQEGLQLMSRGDTFRFWIPGPLAYDNAPTPNAPRGMLVFDVTLYGFGKPLPAGAGQVATDDPQALPEE